MAERGEGSWPWVETAAAVLVLGLFLFSTRSVLNPVFLFFLFWAVMLPYRGREGHGALVGLAAVITLVWVLSTTGTLLAPFVLAVVLAYVLDPLVDILQRRGVPRALAILLLTLPALGALAALLLVGVPAAARQLAALLTDLPVFLDRMADWIELGRTRIAAVDLPFLDEDGLLERLRAVDAASVTAFLEEHRATVGAWVWEQVLGLGRGFGSLFTILGYVALTPMLAFYLLRDWDRLTAALSGLVPEDRREEVVGFAGDADRLVAAYLRGQVTVALIIGLLTGVGLWIVGFPYAATLGLIVAVFSVVPYLGLVLSLVPAVFIALVSGAVWVSLAKVAAVYGAAQVLEGTVVSPRVVGESVGLHPVWVVLALALGGYFFGFVGLLIGVPAAAVAKLLVLRGLERYRASPMYQGGPPAGESPAV